jgi:RimJ/RimL family protein N-acetyltransferase
MSTKPDSVKVLVKCGFTHEGTFRDHVFTWGIFVDIEVYGILNVQK